MNRPPVRPLTCAFLLGALSVPPLATAHGDANPEGLDLQHYRPSANGRGLFGVESPDTLGAWRPYFGLSFNYAHTPFTVRIGDELEALSEYQLVSHLQLGIGIFSFADLGVDVPFALAQAGTPLDTQVASVAARGLGDLRITPRVRVLDGSRAPISLALVVPVTLPTGSPDDYLGEAGVTLNPQVAVGGRVSRLTWAVTAGYRLRPAVEIYYPPVDSYLRLGNEISYGAAVDFRVIDPLRVGLELEGLAGNQPGLGDTPLELRIGAKFTTGGLSANLGAGTGIIGGYGTPTLRALAGLGYSFGGGAGGRRDRDRDGIADKLDGCPQDAEDLDEFQDDDGCPETDNDQDGMVDPQDKCPLAAEVVNGVEDEDGCPEPDKDGDAVPDAQDRCMEESEDRDGFQDQDGCQDADNDQDKVRDALDKCPNEAEDYDGFQDQDGCPEADNDGDGVLDAADKCPKKPESRNGYKDEDGCPEPDADGDGVADPVDKCAKKAENLNGYQDEDGCPEPDADNDGVLDRADKCPRKPETKNDFEDKDGCPDQKPIEGATPAGGTAPAGAPAGTAPSGGTASEGSSPASDAAPAAGAGLGGMAPAVTGAPGDQDGDLLPDQYDKCPRKPETINGFKDDDGCPEVDTDGDGIIDGLDKCPNKPETRNGTKDDDGCPD